MSLYSGVAGHGHAAANGDGNAMAMGAIAGSEMSMMSASENADLMADLDMDMSLNMDLDMDLSQPVTDPSFQSMSQQAIQQQSNGDAFDQTNNISGAAPNGMPAAAPQQQTMTGAGAGPLPHTFGAPVQNSSTTLTEFTKRRNWSQRIIEEIRDFLHILTPDGRIIYASPSCKALTGYQSQSLVGKFIGEYVHPDDSGIFMREFNESIASGNSLRFFYRFKKEDGTYLILECDGHPHMVEDRNTSGFDPGTGINNRCRGFFMMARPYPTKNAALLDSFLGHKIENEKLMRRIEELRAEEQEDNAEADRLTAQQKSTLSAESDSKATSNTGADHDGMPPPAKPSISNIALTQQNLESAQSSQQSENIADKMSRYEANSTHLESIEMLTGLRYRDGERSHGISTGDMSPALVRGDAGIAILLDRDRDGAKKKERKPKTEEEYVCADCGTLDSPEWRKGPKGPKTLCNACGLRWAKKEKKTGTNASPANLVHQRSSGSNQSPLPGTPMSNSMGGGQTTMHQSPTTIPGFMGNNPNIPR
ncbi:Hypothetical protein R9X50_00342200 [Acrodontium crateriforme]|uniref:White collar-2 n=1 Tax=Acrodontium crateriforme TaxID=150365 RepID=A0AAQ3M3Z0_9PEZI|nr:Hypothetical protein R9X50_00342200 [Acrodontium crateriforme]